MTTARRSEFVGRGDPQIQKDIYFSHNNLFFSLAGVTPSYTQTARGTSKDIRDGSTYFIHAFLWFQTIGVEAELVACPLSPPVSVRGVDAARRCDHHGATGEPDGCHREGGDRLRHAKRGVPPRNGLEWNGPKPLWASSKFLFLLFFRA